MAVLLVWKNSKENLMLGSITQKSDTLRLSRVPCAAYLAVFGRRTLSHASQINSGICFLVSDEAETLNARHWPIPSSKLKGKVI